MIDWNDTHVLIGLYLGSWAVGFCSGYVIRIFRRLAEQAV